MIALWGWIVGHQLIVGGAVSAILDLIFALIPSWESNGVLHFIWVSAEKAAGKAPPAA